MTSTAANISALVLCKTKNYLGKTGSIDITRCMAVLKTSDVVTTSDD
jgi:hypothetical protein